MLLFLFQGIPTALVTHLDRVTNDIVWNLSGVGIICNNLLKYQNMSPNVLFIRRMSVFEIHDRDSTFIFNNSSRWGCQNKIYIATWKETAASSVKVSKQIKW